MTTGAPCCTTSHCCVSRLTVSRRRVTASEGSGVCGKLSTVFGVGCLAPTSAQFLLHQVGINCPSLNSCDLKVIFRGRKTKKCHMRKNQCGAE